MALAFDRIRHLLVDLDGVLYRGEALLDGAADFIAWLRERSITFRLVTNNATLTPQRYVAKLARMRISVAPEEVFTSALATAIYLQQEGASGQRACVIGEEGLLGALTAIDMHTDQAPAEWVIVGLDRAVTYEKLSEAALALESGARFVGTNPDTSLPTERGLLPGAGAIQAALVATTGKEPIIIGKPQPLMLRLAMEQIGGTREDTAMVGDRLDTDIQAGNALGMQTVLVLTGVSKPGDIAATGISPSLVVQSLPELVRTWEGTG